MRNTTCSSEPGGIVRTITAWKSARSRPAVPTEVPDPRSQVRETEEEISLKGKTIISWFAAAARARSRAYQESGEARTANLIMTNDQVSMTNVIKLGTFGHWCLVICSFAHSDT